MILLASLAIGCGSSNEPRARRSALVLSYEAFGPSAMAHELLGDAWWAWEPGGNAEVTDTFDIRVVVYDGMSRAEAARLYPTVKGVADHRLVTRAAAIRYLDARIAEIAGVDFADGDLDDRLRIRLAATRALIGG